MEHTNKSKLSSDKNYYLKLKICDYYHFCRIFPISLQIGRNKRQKNATSITLFKLKLHDEVSDLSAEQFLSNDMWDRLVSFGATDRDDAESQIQQSLQDSETEEQKRFTDVSHPYVNSISSSCLIKSDYQPSENKLSGKT